MEAKLANEGLFQSQFSCSQVSIDISRFYSERMTASSKVPNLNVVTFEFGTFELVVVLLSL